MSNLRAHLLTPEDLNLIDDRGAPVSVRPDLVAIGGQGVLLTLKGRQFYALACRKWGIAWDPSTLRSARDVLRLGARLMDARIEAQRTVLAQELQDGKVPLSARAAAAALVAGDLLQWSEAATLRQKCEAAGANVLPILSAKKGSLAQAPLN